MNNSWNTIRNNNYMVEKKKIEWLAVLQGFSMLLVVMGHVTLTNQFGDDSTPVTSGMEKVIYTFHMPLFIFISGWLFYYTCIRKEKSYNDMLMSKAKRLLAPFFVFTVITMVLKLAFPQLMHRMVDTKEIIDTFILFRSNPLGEMWFIIVLFELMLLYPIYQLITKNATSAVVGILISVLLNKNAPPISYFYLGKVAYMLPFFVGGVLCCRFVWQKYIGKYWFFIIIAMLFVVCNVLKLLPKAMNAETALVGTLFSMSLCLIVGRSFPKLFSSFRDYTFQIFLIGIFSQMAIRWIYVRMGNEMLFVPMWLLSVVIGVYVPTLIAKMIQKYAPNGVKICVGL